MIKCERKNKKQNEEKLEKGKYQEKEKETMKGGEKEEKERITERSQEERKIYFPQSKILFFSFLY